MGSPGWRIYRCMFWVFLLCGSVCNARVAACSLFASSNSVVMRELVMSRIEGMYPFAS